VTGPGPEAIARAAAERAARHSYGRLVSLLAARTSDIAAAEDALSEAFAAALESWPTKGVPTNPDAWLLTVARRSDGHRRRHHQVRDEAVSTLLLRLEERLDVPAPDPLDERLKLLFVCAHPAIDEGVRTPLMLQTVLGLDARRIASAFLVAPAAMGQRLVRAKTKIRDAGVRFEVPEPDMLVERLNDVLRAIYVAFGAGVDDLDQGRGLADEALDLGRLLTTLVPDEPEAAGLLALMLYSESRRAARQDTHGRFVPLARQDPAQWDRAMIVEAEGLLARASSHQRFGRFQCEAAIQSVHAQRAITGRIRHDAIRLLYDLLLSKERSLGVAVARAAAFAEAGETAEASAALEALPRDALATYQPAWVTRARIAELRGDSHERRRCLEHALGLTSDLVVRRFLSEQLASMAPGPRTGHPGNEAPSD